MAQSILFRSCRARTLFQGGLIHKLLIISAETDNCPSFLLYTFDDRAYFWSYGPLKTENIFVVSVIFFSFLSFSFLSCFLFFCPLENYLRYFLETLLVLLTESRHLLDVSAVEGMVKCLQPFY